MRDSGSRRVRRAENQEHQDCGDESRQRGAEAEPIVLSLAELKIARRSCSRATIVVTVTDAKTIEEDAAILQAEEVPSQIDDLDGDGTADELAFQVKLAAGQTRLVTIAFGDAATMMRLKGEYPARTHAKFATRYEGAGLESERTACAPVFRQAQRHRSVRQAASVTVSGNVRDARLRLSRGTADRPRHLSQRRRARDQYRGAAKTAN